MRHLTVLRRSAEKRGEKICRRLGSMIPCWPWVGRLVMRDAIGCYCIAHDSLAGVVQYDWVECHRPHCWPLWLNVDARKRRARARGGVPSGNTGKNKKSTNGYLTCRINTYRSMRIACFYKALRDSEAWPLVIAVTSGEPVCFGNSTVMWSIDGSIQTVIHMHALLTGR